MFNDFVELGLPNIFLPSVQLVDSLWCLFAELLADEVWGQLQICQNQRFRQTHRNWCETGVTRPANREWVHSRQHCRCKQHNRLEQLQGDKVFCKRHFHVIHLQEAVPLQRALHQDPPEIHRPRAVVLLEETNGPISCEKASSRRTWHHLVQWTGTFNITKALSSVSNTLYWAHYSLCSVCYRIFLLSINNFTFKILPH